MIENQTIKERLIAYIRYLGIGQGKFEANCGLANGYVNNIRKSITPEKLQQIALCNPDLNTGWLMTGEGEMLRSSVIQKGDNNNNQQGNGNTYNSTSALDKALDSIMAQMQLTKKAHELTANAQRQTDKAQEQMDRLLAIIERMQATPIMQQK